MGRAPVLQTPKALWSITQKLGKHPLEPGCHPDSLPSFSWVTRPQTLAPLHSVSLGAACVLLGSGCACTVETAALNHFAQCQFGSSLLPTFLNISMIDFVCLRLFSALVAVGQVLLLTRHHPLPAYHFIIKAFKQAEKLIQLCNEQSSSHIKIPGFTGFITHLSSLSLANSSYSFCVLQGKLLISVNISHTIN